MLAAFPEAERKRTISSLVRGHFFYKIFNRRLFLSACSNRKTKNLKIEPPFLCRWNSLIKWRFHVQTQREHECYHFEQPLLFEKLLQLQGKVKYNMSHSMISIPQELTNQRIESFFKDKEQQFEVLFILCRQSEG